MKARVGILVTVEVDLPDPYVVNRVTGSKGDEWRAYAYPLHTRDDVLGHLARNAVLNGVERVNRLDGWADLRDEAGTMDVLGATVEDIEIAEGAQR